MKHKIGFALFLFSAFFLQVKGQLIPADAVKLMSRGINIGNTMDAPKEGTWGNAPITNRAFDDYKNAGFTAIRIPITWDLHLSKTAPYAVDSSWMTHVEQVVDSGLKSNLVIIINAHHEGWIKNSYTDANKERFDSLWSQIARRFRNKSDKLIFEIINEPNPMTLVNVNELNKRTLKTIRRTNSTRIVIFSGNSYSNSAELIAATIPDINDKYLIGYYHSYDPYPFGLKGTGSYGSETDKARTNGIFDRVSNWSVQTGIPVILGEYGYMRKCDYNSRMCAYATAVEYALAHGIPAFAWDDNGDFPIYNRKSGGFNEIKDILIHTYKESANKLNISVSNDSIITVQWTNRTTKNGSITVERKVNNGDFIFLKKISPSAKTFSDLTAKTGNSYYYRLKTNLKNSREIQSYPIMISLLPTHQGPN
jgi:hypothetical protein